MKRTHINQAVKKIHEYQQAAMIAKTLGIRRAAGYLRNRGWSLEGALWVLLRKAV